MSTDPNLSGHNLAFVETMYQQWVEDPRRVGAEWRSYFEAMVAGHEPELVARSARGPSLPAPGLFDPARPMSHGPGTAAILAEPPPDAMALVRGVGLFRDLPEDELEHVLGVAAHVELDDGDALFRAGDPGREMFVVVGGGTVLIRKQGRVLAELGSGEVVGEMAVLDGQPRSADAWARGPVRLMRWHGDDLLALLDRRPSMARGVIKMLSRRLRDSGQRQDKVDQLIRAYRVRGHLLADLSPLGRLAHDNAELDPSHWGFGPKDMQLVFATGTIPGRPHMTLAEILEHLRETYCGSVGAQFMHIDDLRIKDWIQRRLEGPEHRRRLSRDEQLRILTKLTDAEAFEQFIHRKFLGAKRFSLEGAESLIPLLDLAIEEAGDDGVEEVVIGMAHRGRLNVLANVMGKSPRRIFREFDDADPEHIERMMGAGDVKYHLGFSNDRLRADGRRLHLTLTFNPSHLEFVGPVVLGRVRAKQERHRDAQRSRRMGIIIHGDSAFAGQGVVQEMLNMSELEGYGTGGTLHLIVNNQIGFTTPPESARSTQYATDVAKMLQVPVFHVNGEHPEPVARVVRMAMEFRKEFKKDVVIDMYCYRRYGHNETDEPAYTQPVLYQQIRQRKSVREGYLDSLLSLGEIRRDEADRIAIERRQALEADLAWARSGEKPDVLEVESGGGVWSTYASPEALRQVDVDTAVPVARLSELLLAQSTAPADFHVHPKLTRMLEGRAEMARGERPLDWAAGESLAFASLVTEGIPVRLSGQDAGRGTFSHRHSVLHDAEDGRRHIPLCHLSPDQACFEVHDSPLTETAVLGFEYGYSLDTPSGLTIWEAQFGDFVNVAQVIIDQFIVSGEDKWRRLSGLVMLLPHGYEGQGPEHSSARLERFLTLAAEDNIQVTNPTTPAQIFHLLRRQVVRKLRKPLIVMSPKSLLRHPEAVSSLDELATGGFRPVIEDGPEIVRAGVRKVLLTSGKLYYELAEARRARKIEDVAILRLEQYYPLRLDRLAEALEGYRPEVPVVWVQDEPRNMGAWPFFCVHVGQRLLGRPLSGVTRPESASPATGSGAAHKIEQQRLVDEAFE